MQKMIFSRNLPKEIYIKMKFPYFNGYSFQSLMLTKREKKEINLKKKSVPIVKQVGLLSMDEILTLRRIDVSLKLRRFNIYKN